jgi:rod shape-determining protein MreD
MANYLTKVLWFVGLILLQVLILNHLQIGGYATPFLYIYFILKFTGVKRNRLMLLAFALGLIIDIFSNSPGMHTAACVLLAFAQPFILRLFTPRDAVAGNIIASFKSIGFFSFLRYTFWCVLIHHSALITIEFFSLMEIGSILIHIGTSTILTLSCLVGIESIRRNG